MYESIYSRVASLRALVFFSAGREKKSLDGEGEGEGLIRLIPRPPPLLRIRNYDARFSQINLNSNFVSKIFVEGARNFLPITLRIFSRRENSFG